MEETPQISQILSGWGNKIKDTFGLLDAETKLRSEKRLLHCNVCHMRSGNTCDTQKLGNHTQTGKAVSGCGCNISAKSLSPGSTCPLGKWDN